MKGYIATGKLRNAAIKIPVFQRTKIGVEIYKDGMVTPRMARSNGKDKMRTVSMVILSSINDLNELLLKHGSLTLSRSNVKAVKFEILLEKKSGIRHRLMVFLAMMLQRKVFISGTIDSLSEYIRIEGRVLITLTNSGVKIISQCLD